MEVDHLIVTIVKNIDTVNTTINHYFSDQIISLDFVSNIEKITELKEIFRAKKNWVELHNIKFGDIKGTTFQHYKDLAISLIKSNVLIN